MSDRCPNCDQRLLPDEEVCWYCGYRVGTEAAVEAPTVQNGWREAADVGTGVPRQLSAATIYALFTAVVILGALLTTAYLGRQPRLQTGLQPPPEAWSVVTNADRDFVVHLPDPWLLLDGSEAEEQTQIASLRASNPYFAAATSPLGDYVDDAETIFIASSEPVVADELPGLFLVVIRSGLLSRIRLGEAAGLLRESDFQGQNVVLEEARVVDNFDKTHAYFQVELPDVGNEGLRCHQQLFRGADDSLLLALCGAPERMNQDTITQILDSAQRLQP